MSIRMSQGSILVNEKEKEKDYISLAPLGTLALLDSLSEDAARKARDNYSSTYKSVQQSIQEAKEEFVANNQSNSIQTILAITNTMVGSVCLVVPQVFLKNGVISCLIVMIVLGVVQYKTCQLLIKHQRPDEIDLEPMIRRILGKYWAIAYRLSSGTLLFIVGIVYFLLINATLFPILEFLFRKFQFTNYSSSSLTPVFNQFSVQYLALIIFIPMAVPLFIKNISRLIKLAEFGVIAIFCYGLFVIYIFIQNISNGTVSQQMDNVVYFSTNIGEAAGQFALAFMIHNGVGPLMGTNKVKENNQRDLKISYSLASIIYGLTGVFGAFGLLGRQRPENPSTILDFFDPEDITVLVIEFLFLVHLVSAFPIFNFISRHQILNVLYPNSSYPDWAFNLFSAIYILICLGAQLINFNPGKVIAFDGAVCGFLIIYIIPIALHMTCYYKEEPVRHQMESKLEDFSLEKTINLGKYNDDDYGSLTSGDLKLECVRHEDKDNFTKQVRWIFYGSFIGVGLFNMFIQFKELFGW